MKKINKKGGGNSFYYNWVEIFTAFILIVGLFASFLGDSALINYVMIGVSGILVGRHYFLNRKRVGFPFYFIIMGYLIGFVIGAEFRNRGNGFAIIVIYLFFIFLGEYLYKKKFLRY